MIDTIPYSSAKPAATRANINPSFIIFSSKDSKKNGSLRHRSHSLPLAHRQATFKTGAWLKPKNLIEPEIADAFINRTLPMLTLNLGQDQLGRIAVVEAAEVGLHAQQLFGPVKRHAIPLQAACTSRLTA
ncbi:MAG: hypothetical protein Q8M84_14475 [Thiobacillus sp.]|nr:hypothetical protein [Thiobacillus sp.]